MIRCGRRQGIWRSRRICVYTMMHQPWIQNKYLSLIRLEHQGAAVPLDSTSRSTKWELAYEREARNNESAIVQCILGVRAPSRLRLAQKHLQRLRVAVCEREQAKGKWTIATKVIVSRRRTRLWQAYSGNPVEMLRAKDQRLSVAAFCTYIMYVRSSPQSRG